LLPQVQDPLVILLLVARVISAALWLLERDAALPYEAMTIMAIVLLDAPFNTPVLFLFSMCSTRGQTSAARSAACSPTRGCARLS
jgi:hypothetical protein